MSFVRLTTTGDNVEELAAAFAARLPIVFVSNDFYARLPR